MTKGQKISISKRMRNGWQPEEIARANRLPLQQVLKYIESKKQKANDKG
jgi:hypothetical protein